MKKYFKYNSKALFKKCSKQVFKYVYSNTSTRTFYKTEFVAESLSDFCAYIKITYEISLQKSC